MILVTGATGFVGQKVAHELRAGQRDVRCLVRERRRAQQLASWGCELVEGDIGDPAALARAVAGCDAVVHLVSIVAGRPAQFERVMSRATRELAAAARDAGVRRIVLMSALGTGPQTRELVPYYRAKWEMELAVAESGVEHVILRPSFVFGREGGVLPLLVRQVRYSPVTTVLGPGTQRVQPLWVDDLAGYAAAAVDEPRAANRTFELGGPDAVTWDELYDRIRRVLGVRRLTVHVPLGLADLNARLTERLPGAPLTRDQVKMLGAGDNTCDMTSALETFGLGVVPLDDQIRRAA